MPNVRKDLPDGDWVELIDPEDLTAKQHRRFTQAIAAASERGSAVTVTLAIRDVLMLSCVKGWSFKDKVPRSNNELADLAIPIKAYRALAKVLDEYAREVDPVDEDELEAPDDAEDPT